MVSAMKQEMCSLCLQMFPLNQMFNVTGRAMCAHCTESELGKIGKEALKDGRVSRLYDPTVCAKCGLDNGGQALPLVKGVPFCPNCRGSVGGRTKFIAAGIILLVIVVAGAWGLMRFGPGGAQVKLAEAKRFREAGQITEALAAITDAARMDPRSLEVGLYGTYLQAIDADRREDFERSLTLLGTIPANDMTARWDVQVLTEAVEDHKALKEKNYTNYLERKQKKLAESPNSALAQGNVAFAYAALYAGTGEETYRNLAYETLAKTAEMTTKYEGLLEETRARVQLAIDTKEVLTAQEYRKKFNKPAPQ